MELTCVQVALPASVKYLLHVCEAVTVYLTPLTLDNAVRHGCLSVLERFQTKSCTTEAMYSALENSHYTVLKWLLTAGKRTSKSIIPDNALRKAAEQGRLDAVELLGGDCSDLAVEKALQYGSRKENWDVVKALHHQCKSRCVALGEALKTAAKMGKEDVVEVLWIKCSEKDVTRALEDAAYGGQWDVVKVLYGQCDPESKEVGAALTNAIAKANWEMVEIISPRAGEKNVVEALKLVVIQQQWSMAKLLCAKLQTREYDGPLQLAERDGGRALLDLLFKRCRCYDAEKAVEEATKHANWTAIKLLAYMCYQDSNNVREAFRLAVKMDRWDVVKRLYKEFSDESVTWAMTQAAERGEWKVVKILRMRCSENVPTTALGSLSAERKDGRRDPSLQLKGPTIRCIVPGNCPFEVEMASARTVNDLKKIIREERPVSFGDVSPDSIWLFLAKRGDEWLSADSEAINLLELGDGSLVRDLLVWQVMSTCLIQDMFEGAPQLSAIHAIAVKPMLRCIIPGSRPFGLNIDSITRIVDLKRAIKAEVPDKLGNVDANDIQLYVAKENGEWLSHASDEAKALMLGEGSPKLNPMLASQLSSMAEVGNPFADMFAIHVIIMTPNRVLGALSSTARRTFHFDIIRGKLLQVL